MRPRVHMLAWCLALGALPAGLSHAQDPDAVAMADMAEGAPKAAGNSLLAYTPIAPCRIIDTRHAGGSLAPGAPRDFRVTGVGLQAQGGNADGCGVPQGTARAAILNFVAVGATGPGNLRGWAYSTPPVGPPTASILNFAAVPGLNIANGIAVPLCEGNSVACPYDLRVQADGNGSQLVVDVVGYFTPHTTLLVETPMSLPWVALGTTCTNVQSVSVEAPTGGKVLVQVISEFYVQHNEGQSDDITAHIATTPTECVPPGGGRTFRRYVAPALPTNEGPDTFSFSRVFTVPAAGNYTFYFNAQAIATAFAEGVQNYRMIAMFIPQ